MQILKKIAFSSVEDGSGELGLSYRSTGAVINTGTLCVSETADVKFYIYGTTTPVVTTGDLAYNTNNLSSLYDGADKYFKVFYNGFAGDAYLIQISAFGIITVIGACP